MPSFRACLPLLVVVLGPALAAGQRAPVPAFAEVVQRDFRLWDRDGDGALSAEEVTHAVLDPEYHGEEAAALAALHTYFAAAQNPPRLTRDWFAAYRPTRFTAPPEGAAIGGPLSIFINDPTNNTKDARAYWHDQNDPTKSWYLTDYGYTPTVAYTRTPRGFSVSAPTPDNLAEPLQYVGFWSMIQPVGTTMVLDAIPSTLTNSAPFQYPATGTPSWTRLFGTVFAQGTFRDQPIRVHFAFNDGVIASDPNGDIIDDTAQSKDAIYGADGTTITGYTPLLVGTVSGHRPDPDHFAPDQPADYVPSNPSFPSGYQNYASKQVRYRLYDVSNVPNAPGDPMPGVWIQERYPNGPLQGQKTNADDGYWWTTALSTALDSASFGKDDGWMPWDHLAYYWNGIDDPSVGHGYYAATKNTTTGAFGIFLGSYQMTFTHGNPDPTKSLNATQTRNP